MLNCIVKSILLAFIVACLPKVSFAGFIVPTVDGEPEAYVVPAAAIVNTLIWQNKDTGKPSYSNPSATTDGSMFQIMNIVTIPRQSAEWNYSANGGADVKAYWKTSILDQFGSVISSTNSAPFFSKEISTTAHHDTITIPVQTNSVVSATFPANSIPNDYKVVVGLILFASNHEGTIEKLGPVLPRKKSDAKKVPELDISSSAGMWAIVVASLLMVEGRRRAGRRAA